MARPSSMFWTYTGFKPKRDFIDPRIPIARQLAWTKLTGDTPYSVPEPDNYNRAIISDKPVECKFVEDQVIYKDTNKNHWVTVMLVNDDSISEYNLWLDRVKPRAHWQHTRAPKIKKQRIIPL